MPVYEVTTKPELSERWGELVAAEGPTAMRANRGEDPYRAEAREQLEALKAEREQLEAEIVAAARIITAERIHPKIWGRIVAEHRPRPEVAWDVQWGVNTDTFDQAIMPHAITSVTDGHGETVEWDWADLATAMTPAKFMEIVGDVLRTHMEREAVPFSLADWTSRHPDAQSSK